MDNWLDWQKLYQYGTIVIWPPDEIRETINSQRQLYDPISQSYCETHITMTQPLNRPLEQQEWKLVEDILMGFEAFEIEYGPLRSFLPYPCIWYQVEPVKLILEIRNALHKTGFFNLSLKHTDDFIPHMTITEGLSGSSVDEALLEQLQSENRKGIFLCKELVYIVPNLRFCFEVTTVLPLAAGA